MTASPGDEHDRWRSEASIGGRGKREFVQVLRLLGTLALEEVHSAEKHLVLC